MPPFNINAYYKNLARAFRGSPGLNKIANKVSDPGDFLSVPVGSAVAFLRASNNAFAHNMSHYGTVSRLTRYSEYNEMETMAEIASALDIYSHEVCAKGEYGEILKIESNNPKVKDALIKLFYDTLNIEFNAAAWLRSLCKYGDHMMLIDHHPDYGIINVLPIPVNEIEREEGYDLKDPTAYRFRWLSHGNKILDHWQVAHFRLLGNDNFLPYGMSILEAARRAWRQLILMEDAVMVYRIVRSPERRVFYVDVGNVSPNDVPAVMEQMKNNLKRNQVVDSSTGQVDLRYNALPVHWSTPIPLLDGRTISIKELANEYNEGKTNWVYSIQDKTHQLVPGKVVWCGKNYVAKKLVKVTLDDGTHMLTAPEHPFVMRDGSSKRADKLNPLDSLMPLYRNINALNYESCYNPATKNNTRTHSWVAKDIYHKEISNTHNFVVHHKEYYKGQTNKLNNSPSNLQIMERHDHSRLHIEHCQKHLNSPEQLALRAKRFTELNKTKEHIQKTIERNKKLQLAQRMGRKYNGSLLHKQHNEIRRDAQKKSWSTDKEQRSKTMRWNIPDECLLIAKNLYKKNPTLPRDAFITLFREDENIQLIVKENNTSLHRDFSKLSRTVFESFLQKHNYASFGEFKVECTGRIKNHKVSSIEIIDADAEVYCMTVMGSRGEDDRHNFAAKSFTSNGESSKSAILLRNSVDEDFYVPVRGSETGTRIDTLPGGQFTGDIDDLQYIQNKLFAALKIPKSYLGYDGDLAGKSTLSQEDVRFARTIQHIQRIFLAELEKIAMIQLYSMGLRDEDLRDFQLSMANPSTINEIQRLELWRTRFEVASIATGQDGVLDKTFIYRHIFRLSDGDIEGIEEGRRQDKMFQLEIDGMQLPPGEADEAVPAAPDDTGAGDAGTDTGDQPPTTGEPGSVTSDPNAPMDNNGVGEGRDPNQQRALPNELRGKVKPTKPFPRTDSAQANVYRMKKNGMDPKRELDLLRRVATAPFGEKKDTDEAIFQKRVAQMKGYSDVIKSIEQLNLHKSDKKIL